MMNNPLFGVSNLNAYLPPPIPVAPINYGGGGMIGGGRYGQGQVVKIEKIYNCVIYEKFMNEFKRMLRKYKNL